MKQALLFARRHWITFGLLATAIVFVVWIVNTQRAPGSMTIIEAQAMDMTTAKPPGGTLDVVVEAVQMRDVVKETTYPATVSALTDEEIVARVAGKLVDLSVYPGDRVEAGQVVGRLEAAELSARSADTGNQAAAKVEAITIARQEIVHHRKMLAKANASLRGADAAISRAKADRETASDEAQAKRQEIEMARAELAEKTADLEYAEKSFVREKRLYDQKAISLDEYQSAAKDRDAAKARRAAAAARIATVQAEAAALDRKVQSSSYSLNEAEAAKEGAQADVDQVQVDLLKAQADVKAATFEAAAARASNRGSQIEAGYRILRATSDGVVSDRAASPGTAVMPGQVILRLKSVDTVRIQAEIPQSMVGQVHVGTPVEIVTGMGSKRARITAVFPSADEQTRTVRVEAKTPNQDGSLVTGTFTRMRFQLGQGVRSLAVPTAAVQTGADGSKFVWLMTERSGEGQEADWTCTMHPEVSKPGPGICPICKMDLTPRSKTGNQVAQKRSVRIGVANETWTAIRDGLALHDLVIVSETAKLQPGTPVSAAPVKKGESPPTSMEGMEH